ncbi:MAG: DUF2461 domain-containing protein [bacterium]
MLDQLISEPFLGFEPEALKFFKSLSNPKYNNKEWFDKNRDTYESFIKEPMKHLIDSLAPEISKIDKNIVVNYKSIFRINRDIRFSKVKTPYKNFSSAAFCFDTIKSAELPHFYFHFSPEEFIFAGGQYSRDPDFLKKIRAAINKNFKEYKSIVMNKKFVKAFGKVQGESLSKLPRGYENIVPEKSDPLLAASLKLKQFYVFTTCKPDVVLDENLIDMIVDNIKLTYDFTKFLHLAIK